MDNNSNETLITPIGQGGSRRVEVLEKTMRIRDLFVDRAEIIAYLLGISPDKREIALVHAMQVGITEIMARRRSRTAA